MKRYVKNVAHKLRITLIDQRHFVAEGIEMEMHEYRASGFKN